MTQRGAPGRVGRRDFVLAAAVPVVAALIAAVAVYRYHAGQQVSWRGIGFGMFATYEQEPSRFIRVEATANGDSRLLRVPPELRELRERAAVTPYDAAARELAEALLARSGADRIDLEVRGHTVDVVDGRLVVGVRTVRQLTVP